MPSYITSYLEKSVQVTPGEAGNIFWAMVYILCVFGGVSLVVVCMKSRVIGTASRLVESSN